MINDCANPACRQPFQYFGGGNQFSADSRSDRRLENAIASRPVPLQTSQQKRSLTATPQTECKTQ